MGKKCWKLGWKVLSADLLCISSTKQGMPLLFGTVAANNSVLASPAGWLILKLAERKSTGNCWGIRGCLFCHQAFGIISLVPIEDFAAVLPSDFDSVLCYPWQRRRAVVFCLSISNFFRHIDVVCLCHRVGCYLYIQYIYGGKERVEDQHEISFNNCEAESHALLVQWFCHQI